VTLGQNSIPAFRQSFFHLVWRHGRHWGCRKFGKI